MFLCWGLWVPIWALQPCIKVITQRPAFKYRKLKNYTEEAHAVPAAGAEDAEWEGKGGLLLFSLGFKPLHPAPAVLSLGSALRGVLRVLPSPSTLSPIPVNFISGKFIFKLKLNHPDTSCNQCLKYLPPDIKPTNNSCPTRGDTKSVFSMNSPPFSQVPLKIPLSWLSLLAGT